MLRKNGSGREDWKMKWLSNKTEEPWKQINLNSMEREVAGGLKVEPTNVQCLMQY